MVQDSRVILFTGRKCTHAAFSCDIYNVIVMNIFATGAYVLLNTINKGLLCTCCCDDEQEAVNYNLSK